MQTLIYSQWVEYQKSILHWQSKIHAYLKAESNSFYPIHVSKVANDMRYISPVISCLQPIGQYYVYVIVDISNGNTEHDSLNKNTIKLVSNIDARSVKLCFTLGEATAYLSRLQRGEGEQNAYIIEPIQVGTCLGHSEKNIDLFKLLCERFLSVISYEETTLTREALNSAHWHWAFDGREAFNIFMGDNLLTQVVYPPSWSVTESEYGPIRGALLSLANEQGLWGLTDANGQFIVPCQYAEINKHADAQVFEAAIKESSSLTWHLIGNNGQRITPEGFNLVPKMYSVISSDIRVVQQNTAPFFYGYMLSTGKLLGSSLWRKVGIHEWDRGWVQDVNTGLYGFVDHSGELVIDCCYAMVTAFQACSRYSTRYAMVATQNGAQKTPLWGCINMGGDVLMEVQWKDICEYSDGYLLVQASASTIHIVTIFGQKMGVSLAVNLPQNATNLYSALTEEQHSDLKQQLKVAIKNKLNIHLTSGMNLADLANKITNERELKAAKLLGAEAILLADIAGYDFLKKGTVVTIGFSYPASAGMFDFKQEVPVQNKQTTQAHCGIGVAWEMLKLV